MFIKINNVNFFFKEEFAFINHIFTDSWSIRNGSLLSCGSCKYSKLTYFFPFYRQQVELHRESVFCPSIPYTLMNTSLRRSNFVTSFNYRKFYILEIQLYRIVWVRRFTIRVSFDWVQNGDHRHANALSINYRTLIALFVIIFRSISNRHPMRIGLHLSMFIVRFMIRGNAHPLSRSWNSSRDTNQ